MRTHPSREKVQGQSRIYTHRLLFFNFVSLSGNSKRRRSAAISDGVKLLNLLSFYPRSSLGIRG